MPPRSSQTALRNLVLVLIVTIGVMIYAYGYIVTDIDLEKPQESTRQVNLSNALRELLSPRIFDQDRELASVKADVLFGSCEGEAPAEAVLVDGQASIIVSPTCGEPGDIINVQAVGFAPEADAQIRWVPPTGQSRPREVIGTNEDLIKLDDNGGFEGQIEVPRIAGANDQVHQIEFRASTPVGAVRFSDTTNEVVRRMAETIFMALVATSLAIPISVVISFFAAHNLMRTIRMPLGSAMVWIVVLPVGYWLGSLILGVIGEAALGLTSGQLGLAAPAMIPLIFGLGATVATRDLGFNKNEPVTERLTAIAMRVGFAALVVAVIGLLGGLGISGERLFASIGDSIRPSEVLTPFQWMVNALADGLAGFGRMIGIFGGVIELVLRPLAGIVGGFALASSVVMLVKPGLRSVTGVVNVGLGIVLGGLSGAIIMIAVGTIGMSAALFGLLPPIVAAMMGRSVAAGLLNRMLPERAAYEKSRAEQTLRFVAGIGGAVGAFVLTFVVLNVGRALILGVLPSPEATGLFGLPQYLVQAGIIGLVLGAVGGGLSGVRATFGIGDVLYNVTREILNALRSIEPLIMGLIFVVWVGIGPFAGVLALMLHSIASLGKLYSEQIETIDSGPIEALQSTGANHLQTIVYSVVPQIVPPYIAFTMYRWDINVRMSTIIGFVGGGGIGLLLNQQINLLRYRDAGVAVLAIAVVVSILDYASAKIRERVL
jgi:phosphonate ABC transporter permease subunit PhnE